MQATKISFISNSKSHPFLQFTGKLVLAILALLNIGFLLFQVIFPPDWHDPFAIMVEKHARLASLPSPKIVILGGSNSLYGIDSKMISDQLNMPVVNMSLQAGLPLEYVLNDAKPYIHPGDLVILPLEYEYYFDSSGNNQSIARLLEIYPRGLFSLPIKKIEQLPDILKIIFQTKLVRMRTKTYSNLDLHQAYTPEGDLVAHLDNPPQPIEPVAFFGSVDGIKTENIQALNAFAKEVKQNGARAVLFFPSSRKTNCAATTTPVFDALFQYLKGQLKVTIISSPEAYCFDDAYFYDTYYHLNRQGRMIRTQKMIQDLQAALPAE